ncbi:hypothetical protein QAD02_016114 [Eretmocerus hayati]|uniref:Uncharacterized protein n=1 Tax=Eretmocerus hayati TaxID=131215 RepID=A0ACC2PA60_9HYME|nr:hypothetical protein QAD02_016114 [Eretmocerus hayati]
MEERSSHTPPGGGLENSTPVEKNTPGEEPEDSVSVTENTPVEESEDSVLARESTSRRGLENSVLVKEETQAEVLEDSSPMEEDTLGEGLEGSVLVEKANLRERLAQASEIDNDANIYKAFIVTRADSPCASSVCDDEFCGEVETTDNEENEIRLVSDDDKRFDDVGSNSCKRRNSGCSMNLSNDFPFVPQIFPRVLEHEESHPRCLSSTVTTPGLEEDVEVPPALRMRVIRSGRNDTGLKESPYDNTEKSENCRFSFGGIASGVKITEIRDVFLPQFSKGLKRQHEYSEVDSEIASKRFAVGSELSKAKILTIGLITYSKDQLFCKERGWPGELGLALNRKSFESYLDAKWVANYDLYWGNNNSRD